MGRSIHKLSVVKINALKAQGTYGDGGGLYLRVKDGGSKSWVFRFAIAGRKREAGLGRYPAVGLAAAREHAEECRRLVAGGVDPIERRKEECEAKRTATAKAITFEACAKAYITAHEPAWRNEKHRRQWHTTLGQYVYPKIGALPVAAIDTAGVLNVLMPIWTAKPETASRVRGRIELVLDWATVQGYRDGANPARWRGHLQHTLPAKRKLQPVTHLAALPFDEIGTLMAALREQTSIGTRALELLILTATRTGETLGARWDEIDIDNMMWTIPRTRMKGGREHRVPLSARSIAILKEMAEIRQNEFIFPGMKQGRSLTETTLRAVLRRLGYSSITVHGFRSTFRDWAGECTSVPREIAEAALAHVTGNAVERAYRRGDAFEKRRVLMQQWGTFCERRESAKVIPLRGRE